MTGWTYYNHAYLPDGNPDEIPDMAAVKDKSVWRKESGKYAYFVRWVSDFDSYDGEWFFCIKDDKFDLGALKAKRRYVINQGMRNFDVRKINPTEFASEIYEVQKRAFSAYPAKYRPSVTKEGVADEMKRFASEAVVYGAFLKDGNKLCGYAVIKVRANVVHLIAQKTIPEYEKLQINAALVFSVLTDYNDALGHYDETTGKKFFISNGERSIQHETEFDNYLIKYFGFRKAQCKLHILYNPKYKLLIKLLYPLRRLLHKLDQVRVIHKINGVLLMEAIVRKQKKNERLRKPNV